jgi:hypothetical protein
MRINRGKVRRDANKMARWLEKNAFGLEYETNEYQKFQSFKKKKAKNNEHDLKLN